MSYILMCVSIAVAVLNSALLHRFANKGLDNTGDKFAFNGGMSAVWCVLLLLLSVFTSTLRFDATTIAYGVGYGVLLCLFQLFKTMAFSTGPVALTTLISACAFLLTTAYTVLFENDTVSLGQGIGIALLLGSLFLCIDLRDSAQKQDSRSKINGAWLLWCFLLFVAGGGLGIFYRLFGRSSASDNMNSMMLFAAFFSAVLFFVCGCIINRVRHDPRPKLSRSALTYVIACGITSCIYIRMNLSLANLISGTVFFPVSNGSMVLLSVLIGRIFFSEKLNRPQIFGVMLGTAAIVMIGVL